MFPDPDINFRSPDAQAAWRVQSLNRLLAGAEQQLYQISPDPERFILISLNQPGGEFTVLRVDPDLVVGFTVSAHGISQHPPEEELDRLLSELLVRGRRFDPRGADVDSVPFRRAIKQLEQLNKLHLPDTTEDDDLSESDQSSYQMSVEEFREALSLIEGQTYVPDLLDDGFEIRGEKVTLVCSYENTAPTRATLRLALVSNSDRGESSDEPIFFDLGGLKLILLDDQLKPHTGSSESPDIFRIKNLEIGASYTALLVRAPVGPTDGRGINLS